MQFGSSKYGLALKTSDLDLKVVPNIDSKANSSIYLKAFDHLVRFVYSEYKEVKEVSGPQFKLLTFLVEDLEVGEIHVDLSLQTNFDLRKVDEAL
jgi:DNA polymerase sigma